MGKLLGDSDDLSGPDTATLITSSRKSEETPLSSSLWPMQVFDPDAEFSIIERKLPHWVQSGTICFITWRTADSIPKSVLARWYADRDAWLCKRSIEPRDPGWRKRHLQLDPVPQADFVRTFSDRWHRHLDSCLGKCVLRQPSISKIVADCLIKFDEGRYQLTDFVIMPNHIHILLAFFNEETMLAQCASGPTGLLSRGRTSERAA